jgi:glycosyltransferase involved in cell wall biosynthesis
VRLGLIARADSRGLGVQTHEFFRHMHPDKVMVVDCPSLKPLPIRGDWYQDATWIKGLPTAADFRVWLKDLDVVYTAETGYGQALWQEADRAWVKTVLHANYEFLDRTDSPTVWAAPSTWMFHDFPDGSVYLPVPVALDRFAAPAVNSDPAGSANHFLHIVGRPAVHDRNGTRDLLDCLRLVQSEIVLTIKCQEPGYVESMIRPLPKNVTVVVDSGDVPNYWDLYKGHDVLVMPRRFGGLCLPVNEALASGMPVIMPNIKPNNDWLPSEWLVRATPAGSFIAKQVVEFYETDPRALAEKIDCFAQDPDFHRTAAETALRLAKKLSWDELKPLYKKVLRG